MSEREAAMEQLLRELLDVVDEESASGEPSIGGDPIGTVNWLLEFADKVEAVVDRKCQESTP